MKCRRYREWMFLNRPGELDEASGRELKQHLSACPECRAELLRTGRGTRLAALAAERTRQTQPIPSAGMTNRILSAVARETRHPEPVRRPWTLPILPGRTGRLVLSGAAACAVLFFAGQEALVLRRVAMLEDRMAENASVRQAGAESRVEKIRGLVSGGPAADDWVTVRKSDLRALADRYPDDPVLRSLSDQLKREDRTGGEIRVVELIRKIENDPLTVEWKRNLEKRGGLPWNRI